MQDLVMCSESDAYYSVDLALEAGGTRQALHGPIYRRVRARKAWRVQHHADSLCVMPCHQDEVSMQLVTSERTHRGFYLALQELVPQTLPGSTTLWDTELCPAATPWLPNSRCLRRTVVRCQGLQASSCWCTPQ
jgi:hypothetical protein